MIELRNISKIFDNGKVALTAVDNVNLTIEQGQIYGIIGYSGAGKSTLIRLLNGLEKPSAGSVTINGQDISAAKGEALRQARLKISMVFQHFNLLWSRTVNENIAFSMQIAGVPKAKITARVAELVELVGLKGREHAYPSQLSGGQKQRVGIARALANNPDVLLCDEATSALDPQTTDQILDLLLDINRRFKLTIVLITHEMDVIRRVCDCVAVMDAGQIVEQGSVADVFLHPQHPTTKRFVQEDEQVDEGEQRDDFAHVPGRIVRLTFQGDATYAPLLGTVARETGVDYSILAGRIDRIKDVPYGQLTLALIGGDMEAAFARFKAADVHMEVLR